MKVGKLETNQNNTQQKTKARKRTKKKALSSEVIMSSVMWRALTSCSP